jgi:hypothetical protein
VTDYLFEQLDRVGVLAVGALGTSLNHEIQMERGDFLCFDCRDQSRHGAAMIVKQDIPKSVGMKVECDRHGMDNLISYVLILAVIGPAFACHFLSSSFATKVAVI